MALHFVHMFTNCPHCQHRFNAKEHMDQEAFLVLERGTPHWKLLETYRFEIDKPKLDEEVYEIAQELFPELDLSSPWRYITTLVKSGYVQEVGKRTSSRGKPARTSVITPFGRKTMKELG